MHHAIFVILCCFILCSTREHSFRPDRILPSPARTVTVKDGASSAPPKACPSPADMLVREILSRKLRDRRAVVVGSLGSGHLPERQRAGAVPPRSRSCGLATPQND